MGHAWNKGYTKETHPSVEKIARTMRANNIDNFAGWRKAKQYPDFKRNGDLAELIGVILGDGHISVHPRTECLRIVLSANNQGSVDRYARLVGIVFGKEPHVAKRKKTNAVNITLYEKHIARRLGIHVGAQAGVRITVPEWIQLSKMFQLRYLRGLYEAEGCYCVHKPTYTYKFVFSNRHRDLLKIVYEMLVGFGFHPHMTKRDVQVSRRLEVEKLIKLVQFREY